MSKQMSACFFISLGLAFSLGWEPCCLQLMSPQADFNSDFENAGKDASWPSWNMRLLGVGGTLIDTPYQSSV